MVSEKECWGCGHVLPLSEFQKHSTSHDGHMNRCMGCRKAKVPARSMTADEAHVVQQRRYYKDAEKSRARARRYYYQDVEKVRKYYQRSKAQKLEQGRLLRVRQKAEAIAGYGGRCVCCGETDARSLTLDHVNNDGSKHREEIGGKGTNRIWRWARINGFPSVLQLLCFNCNCGRHINGGICPHEEVRLTLVA